MEKFLKFGFLVALGLFAPVNAEANPWKELIIKYRNATPQQQLKLNPGVLETVGSCSQQSDCRSAAPHCWQGRCRTCSNPTVTEDLRETGYVRCDEGFCTNSGIVAFAAIFGGRGESQAIDCAEASASNITNFRLGADEYTIGSVAVSYPGQQLASLKCDPGEVATGIKVIADTVIRSITELDCKPVNRLALRAYNRKTPPSPLGNPSGTETQTLAPKGSALVGFHLQYVNELEIDNRVGILTVLHRSQNTESDVAGEDPNAPLFTFGPKDDPRYTRPPSFGYPPIVHAVCPEKYVMTGVRVLYDGDSVKSATPTCQRVLAPEDELATVPEGRYGLGSGSQVGYLGGRTVSNASVYGYHYPPSMCPPGQVMTGWVWRVPYDYPRLSSLRCKPIEEVNGDCTDRSPVLTSTEVILPRGHRSGSGEAPDGVDMVGREGCAMVGYEYKDQKFGGSVSFSTSQIISEIHSLLADRNQIGAGMKGYNFGMGSNASNCWPHTLFNCNTTDWIQVRCPPGSFMVGIDVMGFTDTPTKLGAYCRQVVEGPWTEGIVTTSSPPPPPATAPVKPECTTDLDCGAPRPENCTQPTCREGRCLNTVPECLE